MCGWNTRSLRCSHQQIRAFSHSHIRTLANSHIN
jgi:hypothetical protein